MTYDLFATETNNRGLCTQIDMPDAEVYLYPSFFPPQIADRLFNALKSEISWRQEKIKLYGRIHDIPRLTAWYGDSNKAYTYSGIRVESNLWTPTLLDIKREIERVSNVTFNSVLLNRYRSGSDSVSWHSDDEPELGPNPVIGSVSFGETRPFQLKHKSNKDEKQTIPLENGSYLLMSGATQHHWLHQIPKSKKNLSERINLTFRIIG